MFNKNSDCQANKRIPGEVCFYRLFNVTLFNTCLITAKVLHLKKTKSAITAKHGHHKHKITNMLVTGNLYIRLCLNYLN